MEINLNKIVGYLLVVMLAMLPSITLAAEPSEQTPADGQQTKSIALPDISEIIPKAAELSGKLAALENKIQSKLDLDLFTERYTHIKTNIDQYTHELETLKTSGDYRTTKLIVLRQNIDREHERLSFFSNPLRREVRRLGQWRREWVAEQKQWNQWQAAWLEQDVPEQIQLVFTEANGKITAGLDLIGPQLAIMLTKQENIGDIQEKIYALDAELEGLIMDKRFGTFLYSSPPMYSGRYFSQFTLDLWKASFQSGHSIVWSDAEYWSQLVWIIPFQLFALLVLCVSIYHKRQSLKESEHWRFIGERMFSASLFLIGMVTMMLYEFEGFPLTWKLINAIVVGVSFARVIGCLAQNLWRKHLVYGLTTFLLITGFMEILDFPLPLFRLFIMLASVIGLVCCWKWATDNKRLEGPFIITGLLRLASVFFTVIVVVEIWGKDALAFYLFTAITKSTAVVLLLSLFLRLIHGIAEWLFRVSALRKAVVLYSDDIDSIVQRTMSFIWIAAWGLLLLPALLMVWGVYDSLQKATQGFWDFGFDVGSQRITIGLIIIVIAVLYGSFFVSWIFQKFFLDVLLRKRKIQRGVRVSFERLIHYFVVFIGFMLAISLLGFDITKFTIILSALGVGIGFGLQGIVNDFVSGLILLFERPIRQGDIIEIGGIWAEVKKIGLRATSVQTFDQADLIIPNADLTKNQVTNWTLSSRQVRVTVPVGVAYGSDVPLVFEILTECAKENEMVANHPESQVLFLKFGESSLNFELRAWVKDTDYRLQAKSQLHQEIDKRFREANIVIAFPQRDLHIRSMDKSNLQF